MQGRNMTPQGPDLTQGFDLTPQGVCLTPQGPDLTPQDLDLPGNWSELKVLTCHVLHSPTLPAGIICAVTRTVHSSNLELALSVQDFGEWTLGPLFPVCCPTAAYCLLSASFDPEGGARILSQDLPTIGQLLTTRCGQNTRHPPRTSSRAEE